MWSECEMFFLCFFRCVCLSIHLLSLLSKNIKLTWWGHPGPQRVWLSDLLCTLGKLGGQNWQAEWCRAAPDLQRPSPPPLKCLWGRTGAGHGRTQHVTCGTDAHRNLQPAWPWKRQAWVYNSLTLLITVISYGCIYLIKNTVILSNILKIVNNFSI